MIEESHWGFTQVHVVFLVVCVVIVLCCICVYVSARHRGRPQSEKKPHRQQASQKSREPPTKKGAPPTPQCIY